MKKRLYISLAALMLSTASFAYDKTKAVELEKFYSHMTQKACANSKLFIKPEDIMKMIRDQKDFILLDVRTDGETSVVALKTPNTINIPLSELFKKENLAKLPTDKPLMIVCHSGTRALLAAVGLKQIGFKQTQVVKDGIIGMAAANSVKNAPLK